MDYTDSLSYVTNIIRAYLFGINGQKHKRQSKDASITGCLVLYLLFS